MVIDTHCHIHDREFYTAELAEEVYARARAEGVAMLCVGTSQPDSRAAVEFAKTHDQMWAIVGVHPHEAKDGVDGIGELLADSTPARVARGGVAPSEPNEVSEEGADRNGVPTKQGFVGCGASRLEPSDLRGNSRGISDNGSGVDKNDWIPDRVRNDKVVGIGEIGLDYYYNHSPRDVQIAALEQQLQWALDYQLPVSFHVRDGYDDFWPIFDNFTGLRGVLHSFTDLQTNLEKALDRGLYIGVNGISTFAKDKQDMFAAIPLERMLLETDAPLLTPIPKRGNMNEPAFVRYVATYHAALRGLSSEEIAAITTANARALFAL